jgi:hypothetical protein
MLESFSNSCSPVQILVSVLIQDVELVNSIRFHFTLFKQLISIGVQRNIFKMNRTGNYHWCRSNNFRRQYSGNGNGNPQNRIDGKVLFQEFAGTNASESVSATLYQLKAEGRILESNQSGSFVVIMESHAEKMKKEKHNQLCMYIWRGL